jgi:hypothetical protein
VRRILTKPAKAVPVCALGLLIVVLSIEVSYRTMLFDAYGTELAFYNSDEDLAEADGRETLLCMGDSLTAGLNSWPTGVREHSPNLRVINAGIPGSGILQANFVAPRRFRRFQPRIFVYQINVSNDLLNLRFPVNWSRLNPVRNAYWTVSRRLRSLEFLNYRAGQTAFAFRNRKWLRQVRASGLPELPCEWDTGPFNAESVTPRLNIYLRAEPSLHQDQILATGRRADDYRRLLEGVRTLLDHCERPACEPHVLVVPHAIQVEPEYIDNMRSIGAEIRDRDAIEADDYPFLTGLRDALGPAGVNVIDPLPALRRSVQSGEHVYYRHDPHLNACGQQVLADVVLGELRNRQLMRRPGRPGAERPDKL